MLSMLRGVVLSSCQYLERRDGGVGYEFFTTLTKSVRTDIFRP